jgi:DNA polymerase-3 subunit gamma/tau
VAGSDSELLQISVSEKERVGRVAALFSEEDLARFLQIMLRTHAELGYRQEQRLHLELGLLKMAHARKLLPIEELLSEAAGAHTGQPRTPPTTGSRDAGRAADVAVPRAAPKVSPFAADNARKNTPTMESDESGRTRERAAASNSAAMMQSAGAAGVAVAEPPAAAEPAGIDVDVLRSAVLNALEAAGHRMLVSMLETGEWQLAGNEVAVKATVNNTVAEMAFGAEPKRIATAAASQAAGRSLRMRVTGGAAANGQTPAPRPANGGSRSRAAEDPVVRRMQEKFGAEIRTIIDHRDKR